MSPIDVDAVVFDLFGTIVHWRPERLPVVERGGRSVASTMPLLLPILESGFGPGFDVEAWLEVYSATIHTIETERRIEAVEITCDERFRRAVRALGGSTRLDPDALAAQLARAHMAAVRAVTAAPAAHATAVRRVAGAYRSAVLSNFDDTKTGHEVVADTGLTDLFDTVLISAEVGWRKPNPRIFRHLLETLALPAGRVLFVGDNPREDVAGARGVGMPVVWLSDDEGSFPADVAPPDYVLPDITALPGLLGLD